MGSITSKDTRRISFDNTLALSPSLAIDKSIEEDSILSLRSFTSDQNEDLMFNDIDQCKLCESGEVDYWTNRVECLRKEHQNINKIIEEEYERTIEKTNNLFDGPKITHERIQRVKPCFEWRARISKCYEDNPHQPLVCSGLVQAFSQCVATCRGDS